MRYEVTMTSALDRIVSQANVRSEKAAQDLAKLYRKSGYTTTIYVYDKDGFLVEAGRPQPPETPPRRVRKQWEKRA